MSNHNSHNRYTHVLNQKTEGAHYTPKILSDFMATEAKKLFKSREGKKVLIADPAAGDGELLISLIETFDASEIITVFAFDINRESLSICKQRLNEKFKNLSINLIHGDFLELAANGTLKNKFPKFDLIITNPPYIRTSTMGTDKSQVMANTFGVGGQVDCYHAFLIAIGYCLSTCGVAVVVTSNRFLTTKSSRTLREKLFQLYKIHGIWDFGDTKLFDASVLPVVMVMTLINEKERGEELTKFVSIYETKQPPQSPQKVSTVIDAIEGVGVFLCDNNLKYAVKRGVLAFDGSPRAVWRIEDADTRSWLEKVEKRTWRRFKDIGKIRVGVKTTADSVFVRSDWDKVGNVPELLRSIITHHVSGQFSQGNGELKQILYPHITKCGKRQVVNLDKYPNSKAYLLNNKELLSSRKYLTKAGRQWFEIWVPQNPALWDYEKIVFRDISDKPMFWIDRLGSVVNGDCYWMFNEVENLDNEVLWLILGIANSKFIEKFYDLKFNNKLYSGKRRYISQYVGEFPLPDIATSNSQQIITFAKELYTTKDEARFDELYSDLNDLIDKSFGLN